MPWKGGLAAGGPARQSETGAQDRTPRSRAACRSDPVLEVLIVEQQIKGSIASGALDMEAVSGSFMISHKESDAPWQSKESKALSESERVVRS